MFGFQSSKGGGVNIVNVMFTTLSVSLSLMAGLEFWLSLQNQNIIMVDYYFGVKYQSL